MVWRQRTENVIDSLTMFFTLISPSSEPLDSRSYGVDPQHHTELYLHAQFALAFWTALLQGVTVCR